MHKAVLLVFLVTMFLSNDSCTTCSCQKVTCPPYQDSALDVWIKNFANNTILFKNSNAETDTFRIPAPSPSQSNDVNKGCMGGALGCTAYLSIYSSEQAGLPLKFFLEYNSFTGWDNKISKQVQLGLKQTILNADNISDTGFSIHQPGIQTKFNSALNLNGTNYNNVQLIEVDTSAKTLGPYKIYFARNMGLIAFEEYPSRQLWIRQ